MCFRRKRVDFSFGEKGAAEVARGCTKKLRKTVQIRDEGVQLPAKRRPRPTTRSPGPEQLAVHGQLIMTLPHVKLIDLQSAIVIGGSKHHVFSPPRPPGEVPQLNPN